MQCLNSLKRTRGISIPCPGICCLGWLEVGVLVEGHTKRWHIQDFIKGDQIFAGH